MTATRTLHANAEARPMEDDPYLTPDGRADILDYASKLADNRQDPHSVVTAAAPIFAWVEQATTQADTRARMLALSQQYTNDCWHRRENDGSGLVGYTSVSFVENAKVLYESLVGGAL